MGEDMGGRPSWARVGAKVVCVKEGSWRHVSGPPFPPGVRDPLFGEVVTIANAVFDAFDGLWWILLEGWPSCAAYDLRQFRPAVDDFTEAELLRAKQRDRTRKRNTPADLEHAS